MKLTVVLALLGILGLVAAGCGSAKKGLTAVTVTGTTTITDVTSSTRVSCKDWSGQSAEALTSGANATEIVTLNGTPGSSKLQMRLLKNGSVAAFCKPAK